jgi:2-octaprenyl-6-methoxyphenol hydroxylase
MRQSNAAADIVIAGAGIPGLTLALALAKALKPNFSIAVCDPSLKAEPAEDHRVSAITLSARQMLEALGIWAKIADRAQPVHEMVITDSKLEDVMRPSFLTFEDDGEKSDGPLAHIVEHRALAGALREAAQAEAVWLLPEPVRDFQCGEESVAVSLSDDHSLTTKLLVAADGARSKLRARAKIPSVSTDYKQMGIVATIGHEREHEGIATQHFLPAGTFASLPLTGRRSSIVWAEETKEANRIVALSPEAFKRELVQRFGRKLGGIEVLSPVRAYPLSLSIARSFIGERLALLGDAAHVVHPLAGQGLNLGLRDAAALAESITDAVRLGLDPGGPEVLKRYERWRRFDTVAMAGATDGLNRLFSNRSDTLRVMRDVGLGIVERTPKLKEFFTGEAAGAKGETPKLMRGEVL